MKKKESKKDIILYLLIVIAVFILFVLFIFLFRAKTKNDIYNLSYPQTRIFLEKNGYTFETKTVNALNFTWFGNDEIVISATIDIASREYIIEYSDKSFEGPACCITDTTVNNTDNKIKHYNSYLEWKEEVKITQEQIKEVLINYYLENK